MKTLTAFATALISAAVLFTAAPTASAQEVSRAQVLAELAQARANGDLPNYGADSAYSPSQFMKTASKSRAEVQAELKAARKDGTLEASTNADLVAPAKAKADTRLATTPAKTVTTAE